MPVRPVIRIKPVKPRTNRQPSSGSGTTTAGAVSKSVGLTPVSFPSAGLDQGRLPGLLGYHLRLAHGRVFRDFAQVMQGSGMTAGRLGVLELIDANAGLSQSALARAVGLDRSSLVPVIDELEARGLVARSQGSDRRSHRLVLTPAGRRFIGGMRRRVQAHEQRIAARLTLAQRGQLIALLEQLAQP